MSELKPPALRGRGRRSHVAGMQVIEKDVRYHQHQTLMVNY